MTDSWHTLQNAGRSDQGAPAEQISAATLVELLRGRALRQPDQIAYTFLVDGEADAASLTYLELDRRARAVAALLQSAVAAGERALLLYPPGLDYIAAFFGCLYAGVVVVPAYPPNPARLERTLPRLQGIAADARPQIMLTTSPIRAIAEALVAGDPAFQSLRWLVSDRCDDDAAEEWRDPGANSATLALLQYTSGSTATPKGVMLTHANLLHNSDLIRRAFAHTSASRGVIWLPPYHDMGLIGGIIQPLYAGFPVTLMSPVDFLQRPLRWLQAVSRYGATTSGGPNFAYDLCVRKTTPEQRATLDLSNWRVAFNGAETVRPETLDRFGEAFGPSGFRREAFYPCYGLAEATLLVSGGRVADPPRIRSFRGEALEHNQAIAVSSEQAGVRALVSCGRPLGRMRVVVAGTATAVPCRPGAVGEIWVAGPSVAQGYWGRPDETEQTFRATLADADEGRFVRTGDLGFLHDGELFIAGRSKDLIIIRGRNHYPQDIELTVERSHPALRPGCGAAFAIEVAGAERLAIVQEVERQRQQVDAEAIAGAIRQAVAQQHEVQPYVVVLIKAASIPKTSSGKIQRHACRAEFLAGSLETIGSSLLAEGAADEPDEDTATPARAALLASDTAGRLPLIEAYLREQAARTLRVSATSIDPQQPLTELGLDSLTAIELAHTLEIGLGVVVPMTRILEGASLAQLARELLEQATAVTVPADDRTAAASPSTPVKNPMFLIHEGHEGHEERFLIASSNLREPGGFGRGDRRSSVHLPSHGQRALWFLHQLAPESAAYNIARAFQITGALDLPALRQAFQALMDRHAALRTTFTAQNGEPMQLIHERAVVDFQVEDASDWSDACLYDRLVAEAHRPFDLQRGPLMRVRVFARSAQDHVLALALHHGIVDLWSLVVLLDELRVLYPAISAGEAAPLAPPGLQYTDYVRRQADMLAGPEGERHWAHWKGLADASPVLDLPADRARPPIQAYQGATHTFVLDADVTGGLKALAREHGATLYVVLLAAFQVLLYRYTDQQDLVVGSPASGRTQIGLADVVGYFANPIVLRADLSNTPAFPDLLARTRRTVLAALAHQEYPFTMLVERLQPERDPSRSPLFQVMFVLEQPPRLEAQGVAAFVLDTVGGRMGLGGLVLETLPLERRTAQFDLTLTMVESGGELIGALEYNTDLFDAATIVRMAGHFQTLAGGIAADAGRRVTGLPLMTTAERQQLLVEWNAAGARCQVPGVRGEINDVVCVHQLFEAQAARTPDAVALVYDQRPMTNDEGSAVSVQLTYAELNARANQLAHHLRALGVGPESRVGICMERSAELVIGLLGILKAGGAYVPLDPSYPAERLAFMIADSQVRVVLTQTALDDARRPEGTRMDDSAQSDALIVYRLSSIVYLDADWPAIARQPTHSPASGAAADNLAYLIYTSGSTGRPKGAMNTHRGIANRLLWMQDAYRLTAHDAVLQKTPFSFDVSVWEFFWPLLAGARLVLGRPGGHRESPYLVRLIARSQITTLHFVPSMLQVFLEERGLDACDSLKRIICSGEALPFALQQRCLARLDAQLHNLYGPTEAAVDVTSWECARDAQRQIVPIGRPIANTQIYLLDRRLKPVPIGVPGELYIGGVQLARGYVNRPDLTADRFIPNPFLKDEGRGMKDEETPFILPPSAFRLYKTGDLARWLPDGAIEFLRRLDDQVKIRGFRIEPGEIAAVLDQHPAVRESVVVAREDAPGDRRLVAYLVTRNELQVTSSEDSSLVTELRTFLQERLPSSMLPAAFVLLDALPLTPNGKLDRRALPAPDTSRLMADSTFVAPRTPVEELLASIWAEVLRLERVGVEDNFFEAGGHSLLATQVIARMRDIFQVELPLRSLFEAPTVAGLAARIAGAQQRSETLSRPPLRPVPRDGMLPLSFAQQRLWFLDQLQPNSPVYNVPLTLRLDGPLDIVALQQSMNGIVARHEALRTTFAMEQGEPVQMIAPAQAVPLPLLDLRALPLPARTELAQQLTTAEMQRSFNLARGPLLRMTLLRLAAAEHILLLTMHHIVSDGWSLGVLFNELVTLYRAHRTGQAAALPALPIQYADYAVWQRQWLEGAVLEAQLAYWRTQMANLPVLDLPLDRPRPPQPSFQGASCGFVLPPALSADLLALSRREGGTLFMTLVAAWQVVLARYSDRADLAIGTDVANRTHAETEGLIGFFVNQLVLRGNLAGNPPFRALLAQVRERTLEAYAHQDLPFEQLVKELNPERSLNLTPLFQVKLILQNAPMSDLELPELTLRPLEQPQPMARFDLVLFLTEEADGLAGAAVYSTDLFDATTIDRIVMHFQTLLSGVVADPAQRIADLPFLTVAERQQLLVDWNATEAVYPHDASIHQLFAMQVTRSPDSIALVSAEAHLTYWALDARANQLAHELRNLGVGPEVRVALCLERSLELVVAVFGVLKAGGAYVPIEPGYPATRLDFMLADSQAPILVTQARLVDELPAHWGVLVCLDSDWDAIAQQPEAPPDSGVRGENLAYVIYTSGSTGQPKGVLIPHRGVVNYLCWCIQAYNVAAGRGAPVHSSIGFDLTITSLFAPLLVGQRVELLPEDAAGTALGAALLRDSEFSLVKLTPTHLDLLAQSLPPTAVERRTQALIIGGEALRGESLAFWRTYAPATRLINEYGPTETVVGCCVYEVPAGATLAGVVPIGRPIANTQLYVLDIHLQPVPIGVAGELYIGGVGLAHGYLNRPDLTAELFVPNPFLKHEGGGMEDEVESFSPHPSSLRLYKTGDLARYRLDGTLEFLGRLDQQVKIRGFRIEPAEIEMILGRHRAVRECLVLAREDVPSDRRLVAYVVTSDKSQVMSKESHSASGEGDSSLITQNSLLVTQLRDYLKQTLPDYMVPSAFVLLDALPLTAHGKVDRRALPAPAMARPTPAETFVVPRTPVEEVLAQIWADVLHLERVGVHDNFFDSGGHSLLATQVISRVRVTFGVELLLRNLFEAPTVAGLAELIEARLVETIAELSEDDARLLL